MKLTIEESSQKSRALFISNRTLLIESALQDELTSYNYEIVSQDTLSKITGHFDYIFIFDQPIEKKDVERLQQHTKKPLFIFTKNHKLFAQTIHILHASKSVSGKSIFLTNDNDDKDAVEKILWFASSSTKDLYLTIEKLQRRHEKTEYKKPRKLMLPSRKKIFIFGIFAFLIIELFFVLPLITTAFFIQRAYTDILNDSQSTQRSLAVAQLSLDITNITYAFSRPTLSFFFLAIFPDSIVAVENTSVQTLSIALSLKKTGQQIVPLLVKNPKNSSEQKKVAEKILQLKTQTHEMGETVQTLSQEVSALPSLPLFPRDALSQKLSQATKLTETSLQIVDHLDSIIGSPTEKTYVVFFYNNMELRPGGGFIGSFAIAKFSNYTLNEFKVYDVYDADGQLKAHIEPPGAIRTYLKQPHWFLRDSNFSADFSQNIKNAEYFLEKEMGISHFDGAIGITTTGIANLIGAYGSIYLPDSKDTISKDNFYIKTQLSVEKDFFPGSTKKKNVLSSLVNAMILSTEDVSAVAIGSALQRSLEEKQLVLYFKDPLIQQDIERAGWDGNIRLPRCVVTIQNCMVNTIIPIDANLGVNKANLFVSRVMKMRSDMQADGSSRNRLTVTFANNSPENVFPGGPYKNYFQLYLPNSTRALAATIDGVPVSWDERSDGNYKIISVFLTVEPQKNKQIEILYSLPSAGTGNGAYQLTIQKQIGTDNDDFSFEFHTPPNITIINNNFSALEKKGVLFYNTHLSTDKIFLIEFVMR